MMPQGGFRILGCLTQGFLPLGIVLILLAISLSSLGFPADVANEGSLLTLVASEKFGDCPLQRPVRFGIGLWMRQIASF